ncbi:DUF397 domain-containing protein [Streptomyces botrytidirepellens]|uniref:DUF397 domain-containing protein n=1 Tax=Streptomyces botrytidirepellens TaxID=2486417 RepID=A0A3M8W7Z2_9ACTN|nr:DUF397 domain-containing protein [Streptomyces botrytidirepellens]RNG26222.1 DUF397 domain-containing protein [Streptomyces botrytidirepellens]
MMRHNLPEDAWKKSSYSGDNGGTCVETQMTADDLVAVGDSKDRALGAHTFGPAQWQEFVTAVRNGAL